MMLNLQSYTTTVLNEKCDILGVKTYFNPTYFQGVSPYPRNPQDLLHWAVKWRSNRSFDS